MAEVSEGIREAMARRVRTDFLPPDVHRGAGEDRPLPIGHGQTNSQPSTVAVMLALLEVRTGHRVLDVGSGSGWTTAVLGDLVGPDGSVTGVERVPALVDRSRLALAAQQSSGGPMTWVEIRQATEGVLGVPDLGPFERILVSAEAAEVPSPLLGQLTPAGVMVVPVRGEMLRIRRTGPRPEDHAITRHGSFRFVPLIED
ncbi:MAG: protein-L-isoaspartate O-methyltransferase family protein [Brevibacterium yomogidense]|uniref:Protein-L-isoaspartate O-methyltransferase n=1 Tax=Brevibacterium yomogidense TaxID=946573 RepID=A0A1X6XP20_9MICO|nr:MULTISPECIES: protein-L-isoaspartate carboxylmethyltransferase [Brevibacterium]SLN00893.1 Protein-L-isoaspartate O-methyltransferase [Brevibacterium yomogidense]SMX74449.1 protein-L-isoaspartate(D-aspartate) O-methyltransferase [Brevibacterium sp. Mu109]